MANMRLTELFARWFGLKKTKPQNSAPPLQVLPQPQEVTPVEVIESASPQPTNPREALEARCYDIGYTTARQSGATKPNAAMIQSLEARAAGLAQAVHVPSSDVRDQRRIAQLAELVEDAERRRNDHDLHGVYDADARRKLAEHGPRLPRPVFPQAFYYTSLIGLSISIAPTFHDMFVGVDPFLKWVAGAVCGGGVSVLIVHGILHASPHGDGDAQNKENRQ